MIYLADVLRGQLDPVFSFKDEHKSKQDLTIHVQIPKCGFSGLCKISFNSHEDYNTSYNTCSCTTKLYKK